jgi:hypothetical protein
VISYRARLDVPITLVLYVSGLLATHRRSIGNRKQAPAESSAAQNAYSVDEGCDPLWVRPPGGLTWLMPPRRGRLDGSFPPLRTHG